MSSIKNAELQTFEKELNYLLLDTERKVRGCFSVLRAANSTVKKMVEQSQEERQMYVNKEQKEAERRQKREEELQREREKEVEMLRLEALKATENDPKPDPSLPNQRCIIDYEEDNQALMFGCRAADGSELEEVHYICKGCCLGYAEAKLGEGALSDGGIGFPCTHPGCNGVLLWGPLKKLLPERLTKHLDKQFDTTALHGIDGIEYCKSCTYGTVIEQKYMKFFACQNKDCMAKFCRHCKTDYEKHIDKDKKVITCDEADPTRKDKRIALEEFLSASKFRVCSNCGTRYTKDSDGSCNKMTCTCKTTQCYICKESNINYNHFGDGKCQLFTDTIEADRINLENAINEARNNEQWREFLPALLEMRKK